MSAIAALPMYDAPSARPANDALWELLAERLADAGFTDIPDQLTRERSPEVIWADPRLLLAQTCGYPLVTSLRGRVRLVSTPVYRASGCEGPRYRSAFLVAGNSPAVSLADLRGRRCAINDPASNSGANLLRLEIAKIADGAHFFTEVVVTGSHAASVEAVAGGSADIASVDCVTLAQLRRDAPDLVSGVRLLGWSSLSPGLPFITGIATPAERVPTLRRALQRAVESLRPELRDLLMIERVVPMRTSAYSEILRDERYAVERGYPALA